MKSPFIKTLTVIAAKHRTALAAGCISVGLISPTGAALVDLTTSVTATGIINGAIYRVDNSSPAGTGIFGRDSGGVFLQIQELGPDTSRDGVEQGYNTDATGVMDNGGPPPANFNHSILYSSLNQVTIGGQQYHSFILDVNEPNNSVERLITLERLQIFSSTDPALSHSTLGGLAGDAATTLLYDMDGLPDGDSSVLLDYDLIGRGSGVADMGLFIPISNFAGVNPGDNIILYSEFSDAQSGFEEWTLGAAAGPDDDPEGPGVPEPSTAMLGVIGLIMILRRRMK